MKITLQHEYLQNPFPPIFLLQEYLLLPKRFSAALIGEQHQNKHQTCKTLSAALISGAAASKLTLQLNDHS